MNSVWISREFHVKLFSRKIHVKTTCEFNVKLFSREIHMTYFTWIVCEERFTWNSHEKRTLISREIYVQNFQEEL